MADETRTSTPDRLQAANTEGRSGTDSVQPRLRGFAGMDPARQREIASLGGRAAHELGVAHQFTPEEAAAAGRKGGRARQRGAGGPGQTGR
jgi:general stress protein YciG